MTDTSPRAAWDTVVTAAALPSEHAAIISARREYGRRPGPPPYPEMLDHYTRAIDVFAWTDTLRLSAVDITDLIRVVGTAMAGLPGTGIHAAARHRLIRTRLVTRIGGRPADTVRATIAGIAVARAATPHTLPLSSTEIECLARLAAHGDTAAWPGSAETHYLAMFWQLVTHEEDRFRLTRLGEEILALNRDRFIAQAAPSIDQAHILDVCGRAGTRGSTLRGFGRSAVHSTQIQGWITRIGSGMATRWRLTPTGRVALARLTARTACAGGETIDLPITAAQLRKGMRVRMINRRRTGIGPEYLWVSRTEKIAVGDRGQVAWRVWVTDTRDGEPRLYGGRAFHPATRYEVIPAPVTTGPPPRCGDGPASHPVAPHRKGTDRL